MYSLTKCVQFIHKKQNTTKPILNFYSVHPRMRLPPRQRRADDSNAHQSHQPAASPMQHRYFFLIKNKSSIELSSMLLSILINYRMPDNIRHSKDNKHYAHFIFLLLLLRELLCLCFYILSQKFLIYIDAQSRQMISIQIYKIRWNTYNYSNFVWKYRTVSQIVWIRHKIDVGLDDVLLFEKNMIFLIINHNNIDVVQRKKSILIEVRLRKIRNNYFQSPFCR